MGKNRSNNSNNKGSNNTDNNTNMSLEEYEHQLNKRLISWEYGDENAVIDEKLAGNSSAKDVSQLTDEDFEDIKQHIELYVQTNWRRNLEAPIGRLQGYTNTMEQIKRTIINHKGTDWTGVPQQVINDLKQLQKTGKYIGKPEIGSRLHIPPTNIGLDGPAGADYYPWL